MKVKIHSSWQKYLQSEFDKPYFEQLTSFVRQEYATQTTQDNGHSGSWIVEAQVFEGKCSEKGRLPT